MFHSFCMFTSGYIAEWIVSDPFQSFMLPATSVAPKKQKQAQIPMCDYPPNKYAWQKKNIVYIYIYVYTHTMLFRATCISKPIMTFQYFSSHVGFFCPSFHQEISIDELLTGPISLILAASVPLVPTPLESFLKTFCCAAWSKQSGKNPNALKTFHSTHLGMSENGVYPQL